MAEFGLETTWEAIPGLGLTAFAHEFEAGEVHRTIKVYLVPEALRADRYFIAETPIGEVEEVPPSLVRNTHLLVHFILPAEGDANIVFVHPEVQAA